MPSVQFRPPAKKRWSCQSRRLVLHSLVAERHLHEGLVPRFVIPRVFLTRRGEADGLLAVDQVGKPESPRCRLPPL